VLADAGLIEEASEHARDRRDRVWVARAPTGANAMLSQRLVWLTAVELGVLVERIEAVISAAVDAHDREDPDSRSWQIGVLAIDAS
jgi:hypothetical protein